MSRVAEDRRACTMTATVSNTEQGLRQGGVTGVAQLLPQNTLTPWVNQDWRAEEAWDEADGDSFNLASSQE